MARRNVLQRPHRQTVPYHDGLAKLGQESKSGAREVLRHILNAYVNNPEAKFLGPRGNQCNLHTRGILQRDHVIAGLHRYCGKEFKRKLEQGPVDHEIDFKCKVYGNGRVVADPETLRKLEDFTERQIANETGLHRKPMRLFKHGKTVTPRTYQRIITFLREQRGRAQ
jgi:hypothetical protein